MPTIDDIVKSQDQLPPTGVPGAPLSLDIGPAVALNSAPPIPIETPVLESSGAPAPGGGPVASDTPASTPEDPQFKNAQPQSVAMGLAQKGAFSPDSPRDLVSDYIKKKLNLGRVDVNDDPELMAAKRQDAINSAGRDVAGIGDALYKHSVGLAGIRQGGGGYNPGAADSIIGAPPKNQVDALIQKRLQDRASVKSDAEALKDAAQADKDLSGENPNSQEALYKAERLRLAGADLGRKTEEFRAAQKTRDEALVERKRSNQVREELGRLSAELRKSGQTQQADRLEMARKSLDIREEKLDNEEGAGTVQGAKSQNHYLPKPETKEVNDKIGAAQEANTAISEILELKRKHGLGLLTPSEATSQAETLAAALPRLINNATSKLGLTGSAIRIAHDEFKDPTKLKNAIKDLLTGGNYTEPALKELQKIIRSTVQKSAGARGVELNDDLSPSTGAPHVLSARPGRVGSGTGPGEIPERIAPANDKVKVQLPNGRTGRILRSEIKAFLDDPDNKGAKVFDGK